MVWETRGQHRRLSPKNQCGHFQALLPRAQVGRDVVEEKEEEESISSKWRAEEGQGSRRIMDEHNTTPNQARNTFRGTSMERAIPRLCLAFLGRDGPRNGRIGGGRSSSLSTLMDNLSRTAQHSSNQTTHMFRL